MPSPSRPSPRSAADARSAAASANAAPSPASLSISASVPHGEPNAIQTSPWPFSTRVRASTTGSCQATTARSISARIASDRDATRRRSRRSAVAVRAAAPASRPVASPTAAVDVGAARRVGIRRAQRPPGGEVGGVARIGGPPRDRAAAAPGSTGALGELRRDFLARERDRGRDPRRRIDRQVARGEVEGHRDAPSARVCRRGDLAQLRGRIEPAEARRERPARIAERLGRARRVLRALGARRERDARSSRRDVSGRVVHARVLARRLERLACGVDRLRGGPLRPLRERVRDRVSDRLAPHRCHRDAPEPGGGFAPRLDGRDVGRGCFRGPFRGVARIAVRGPARSARRARARVAVRSGRRVERRVAARSLLQGGIRERAAGEHRELPPDGREIRGRHGGEQRRRERLRERGRLGVAGREPARPQPVAARRRSLTAASSLATRPAPRARPARRRRARARSLPSRPRGRPRRAGPPRARRSRAAASLRSDARRGRRSALASGERGHAARRRLPHHRCDRDRERRDRPRARGRARSRPSSLGHDVGGAARSEVVVEKPGHDPGDRLELRAGDERRRGLARVPPLEVEELVVERGPVAGDVSEVT